MSRTASRADRRPAGARPRKRPAPVEPPGASDLLQALRFAAEKHRDQRRKGAVASPYINHPIAVAEQLATAGFQDDTELLMAAVLHDVLEDTDTTQAELAATCGARVAKIVLEVTDDKSLPRRERRARVVSGIAAHSRAARLVKLSDLIANVYDVIHHPPHWTDEQKLEYLDWSAAVVRELAGTHPGLEQRFAGLLAQARALVGPAAGHG
jgi:guanosine-3',5'-bis(diphosphate) 3'-pyrophosphohydrolase